VNKGNAIILFDGECNLCTGSILFIIKRDPKEYFRFATLQTEIGKMILRENNINPHQVDSIILVEKGKVYYRSDAVIKISRRLKGVWSVYYIFIIIPPVIRNFFYDLVARNRYRWFGKQPKCFVPDQKFRNRFI